MKRTIAVLLAVMMLVGVLTACSGTVGMDDGQAYGNVSTTPDGRVNGGANNGMTGSGMAGNTGRSDSGMTRGGMSGSNSGFAGGMSGGNSGTGMTGGR